MSALLLVQKKPLTSRPPLPEAGRGGVIDHSPDADRYLPTLIDVQTRWVDHAPVVSQTFASLRLFVRLLADIESGKESKDRHCVLACRAMLL
jgi:hypothetical protein